MIGVSDNGQWSATEHMEGSYALVDNCNALNFCDFGWRGVGFQCGNAMYQAEGWYD